MVHEDHEGHEHHGFTSPYPCGVVGLVKKRLLWLRQKQPFPYYCHRWQVPLNLYRAYECER